MGIIVGRIVDPIGMIVGMAYITVDILVGIIPGIIRIIYNSRYTL